MRARGIVPCLALLIVAFALPTRSVLAQAQSDSKAFMADIGDRVIKIVADKEMPEAQRKEQFRQLVESKFDVPTISRFVLGRYWRTATDQQKQQFQSVFETYMINVYWSHFTSYNGERFNVTGAQEQGAGNVTVTSNILRSPNDPQPVKVSWYLRKAGTSYKIEDASLEGVSQLVTYRDEFSSIIEQNNGQVSALIDKLTERTKG
jgi:phospholipid transport system substrate-binding protein